MKPSVSLRLSRREKICVATDPLMFVSSSENVEASTWENYGHGDY